MDRKSTAFDLLEDLGFDASESFTRSGGTKNNPRNVRHIWVRSDRISIISIVLTTAALDAGITGLLALISIPFILGKHHIHS